MTKESIARIGMGIAAVFGAATFCIVLWFIVATLWGVPLHDVRLWLLERGFQAAAAYHPRESIMLKKKAYLGGPYTHGSLTCDYFVGELRAAPLLKEEIRQAYSEHSIYSFDKSGPVPLTVLFVDEEGWPMDAPLGVWWDEWRQSPLIAASGTSYFVFAAQTGYPFLGDYRCDD